MDCKSSRIGKIIPSSSYETSEVHAGLRFSYIIYVTLTTTTTTTTPPKANKKEFFSVVTGTSDKRWVS